MARHLTNHASISKGHPLKKKINNNKESHKEMRTLPAHSLKENSQYKEKNAQYHTYQIMQIKTHNEGSAHPC